MAAEHEGKVLAETGGEGGGKVGFGEAFSLLLKTTPFLVARLTIYGIFFAATLVWFAIFGGLAALFHRASSTVSGVLVLFAFGAWGGALWWVRRYLLYLLQAGHIAVLVELHTKGELPDGVDQVSYGKKIVTERVKEISVLFAVDALVTGILRSISRAIVSIADWLPIPGVEKLAGVIMKIIERSMTYVDEAIFAYGLAKGIENPWEAARDGVILYAQSWKPLLKGAVFVWLGGWCLVAVLGLILIVPGALLAYALPAIGFVSFVVPLLLAYLIHLAVFEPLALAYMILVYLKTVEGMEPDPAWSERINGITHKFRELEERARAGWTGMGHGGETPPAAAGGGS